MHVLKSSCLFASSTFLEAFGGIPAGALLKKNVYHACP